MKRTEFKRRIRLNENHPSFGPRLLSRNSSELESYRMKRNQKPLRAKRLTTKDSEARIKQELTTLTSLIVRMRDRYCVICGSNWELQNGHFFHRDIPPTEFDLTNCWALCKRCNDRHEYRPAEYTAWIKAKLGDEAFAALEFKAHRQTKLSYIDLWELREQYRAMLRQAKWEAA